ncbi:hypothetical protein [Bradyrhizobium erythrophlei]|nr:hypothetical protein [Bradyrhizobium erythrophlei]
MEKALGKSIPADVRCKIKSLVERYYIKYSFEETAPFKDDVLSRISAIRRATIKLRQTLQIDKTDGADGAARAALAKLATVMRHRQVVPSLKSDLLPRLIAGIDLAEQNVRTTTSFVDGEAWREFAISVKEAFKSSGLPCGASHDGGAAGNGSPFVRFFAELQRSFPEEKYRRHYNGSPATLAKEINRAGELGRTPSSTPQAVSGRAG